MVGGEEYTRRPCLYTVAHVVRHVSVVKYSFFNILKMYFVFFLYFLRPGSGIFYYVWWANFWLVTKNLTILLQDHFCSCLARCFRETWTRHITLLMIQTCLSWAGNRLGSPNFWWCLSLKTVLLCRGTSKILRGFKTFLIQKSLFFKYKQFDINFFSWGGV